MTGSSAFFASHPYLVVLKMHSFTSPALALAALAAFPVVSAHGYVSGIVAGGKWYLGSNPNWYYLPSKPVTAGWYALNQDNGFVSPSAYGTQV